MKNNQSGCRSGIRQQLKSLILACLIVVASGIAVAQTPSATIVGVVRDPSGLPVPSAAITVRNVNTGEQRKASSGAQGEFTVPNLAPAVYDVSVRGEGFQELRQTGVQLQVDQVARLDFALQVGALAQAIEVEAQVPVINTENATRGEVITNLEITQMPLPGRSFADLAYMVPGVAEAGDGMAGFAVNGARTDNTSLVLDGVSARNTGSGALLLSANLESVQEFRMITNNYSAEYGQFAGGVMNLALKSGTNQVHGSVFWFARDAAFEARNVFAAQKGDLRRHQYGASLNGPVVIPRLYDGRNRTFFLFSWESLNQRRPNNNIITVPTPEMRRGDFSRLLTAAGRPVVLRDPYSSGQVFPGAVMPSSLFNPIAVKVNPYWPEPNRPGSFNNVAMDNNQITDSASFTMKIDQNITSSDRLSFRLALLESSSRGNLRNDWAPAFTSEGNTGQPVGGVNYTRTLSPTLLLDLRAGVSRARADTDSSFRGRNVVAELGIPGLTVAPHRITFPQVGVTGMASLGDFYAIPGSFTASTTYQYAGVLTWVRGGHTIKTGGERSQGNWYTSGTGWFNGYFNFLGRWTNEAYADFLLGLIDSTRRNLRESHTYAFNAFYSAFLQDDIRVSPRLTLNLGIRYELPLPTQEKNGRWASFLPEFEKTVISSGRSLPALSEELAAGGLAGKVVTAKDLGLPEALVYTKYRNFAPRLGLAWRPFAGNRTVLRAGYGIFFGGNYLQPVATLFGGAYPFAVLQQFVRLASDPSFLTLSNPYPGDRVTIVGATATQGYDLHAKAPYLQSYNLTVEREVSRHLVVEAAYSGSKGTHQGRGYDLNQPYYYQEEFRTGTAIPRPYPGWAGINYFSFGSSSTFHSGQLTLRKRSARGFFYRLNYVFGKSIDDASTYWHVSQGGYSGAQDSRNLGLERGRSDFDNRHAVTFNFSWPLPWKSWYARGWQLAGTGRVESGKPFTPRTSLASLALGESNRPDRIREGGVANPSPDQWFDRGAFEPVPSGAFRPGNSGRNILDCPGFVGLNFALSRNFLLGMRDRDRLQFRWEVFNAPNTPNFLTPNTNVNERDGGTIRRARDGRSMQFALRYEF